MKECVILSWFFLKNPNELFGQPNTVPTTQAVSEPSRCVYSLLAPHPSVMSSSGFGTNKPAVFILLVKMQWELWI